MLEQFTEEEKKIIDEKSKLPYSELTEEEIDIMVRFKAEVFAYDHKFQEELKEAQRRNEKELKQNKEFENANLDILNKLADAAIKRLENVEAQSK